jgi:opacity protein-like surface antigen
MSVRKHMTRSLALAAAIAVVAVPLAAQQDTTKLRRTRSDQRINVSKGEVELRVDTVYITRYDTVRVDRMTVRVDTVTVTTPAPIIPKKLPSDWYWGPFAGGTGPISDIDRVNTNGYHLGALIGYQPPWFSWLGARVTGSYTQIGREQGLPVAFVGTGLPQMWQFSFDLKPRANFGGWSLYGIGGLGFNSYKRLATVSDDQFDNDVTLTPFDSLPLNLDDVDDFDDFLVCGLEDNACYRPATRNWRTKFSWNFGAGTDFHIGSQDMFIEWRWNPIRTHDSWTWYMPISLGLRYF